MKHSKNSYMSYSDVIRLALLLLSCSNLSCSSLPKKIKILGIFEEGGNPANEAAFKAAIETINRNQDMNQDGHITLRGTEIVPQILHIRPGASYFAETMVCNHLSKGNVMAIFGPQDDYIAEHIKSITDMVEVPFIDTRWNYDLSNPIKTTEDPNYDPTADYTMNLHPDISTVAMAYNDLIGKYGWDAVTILYENNESMSRLKEVLDRTAKSIRYPGMFKVVVKQLLEDGESGYREALREVYKSKSNIVILDCSKETLEKVLIQAQQVSIVSESYYYLLTSLDAHTVDLEPFKHGGTNFTAFRIIDTNRQEVRNVVNQIVTKLLDSGESGDVVKNGEIDTTSGLIYDAVTLFARSLSELSMYQSIEEVPRLDCNSDRAWTHGSSLINYMKFGDFVGLSGKITFDTYGRRTNFYLDVLELQSTGLEPIGTWSPEDSLNLTRVVKDQTALVAANPLANKTFVVTVIETQPYTMLKLSKDQLVGNDRFEGFAVELMTEISKYLGFNITFQIVADGNYGAESPPDSGKWNGMIGEVLMPIEDGGADFAIADLSMTSSRSAVVEFSMPWMTLGISIVFTVPRKAPPSMLAFLEPFKYDLWGMIVVGLVIVSLAFFVLARLTPYEWDNPYPCIEDPDELENMFSLANSFWFTVASLMQQGSDVAPASSSNRILASVWFLFAMIVIASYTANLAAFLTVETLEKPISSASDLQKQDKIKYGVVKGGSTAKFFQTSTEELYQKMGQYMNDNPDVFVESNAAGIKRVEDMDGKYAFFMESSSIQYIIERNCAVTQIGGTLDTKGYAIAMKPGLPYKPYIDSAILHLLENGEIHKSRTKWWKQKRGGGACSNLGGGGGLALGMPNVVGVFIVTIGGCIFATILAFIEFLYGSYQKSKEMGSTWVEEMREELKFAMICHGNTKPVRKPPSENSSLASGKSGSSSASGKSGKSSGSKSSDDGSSAEKGGDPSPYPPRTFSSRQNGSGPRSGSGHYPRNVHSSQSSVENHYPKSNGSNPYGYGKRGGTQTPTSNLYGRSGTGNPFE